MDSVLDFLVLESLYKISICAKWEEGDRFRSLIDGKFWYGSIKEKKAFRYSILLMLRVPRQYTLAQYAAQFNSMQ